MENNDWQLTEHRAMQRHTAAAMRLLLDAGLRADRRGFSQAAGAAVHPVRAAGA